MRRLSFILAPLSVALVAGAFIYKLFPTDTDVTQKSLRFEFVKFLIQLIVIVILGGILIHEYNRGRDRVKASNELRKDLLTNLISAYFKAKKARRILEGNIHLNTTTGANEILYSAYEAQIKEIIDAQLEFEFHAYQLDTFQYVFPKKNRIPLQQHATALERYLNQVIDEYQKLKASSGTVNISTLTILSAFIDSAKFKPNFSSHFHSSVKLIEEGILKI